MRPEEMRIEPDAGNPVREESRVLPGRHTLICTTPAVEQKLPGLLAGGLYCK
jgi:hypothetical protein